MVEFSDIAVGLVWYVVLIFSLTLHEAAHAWAAKRGGDLTAYRGGQVSLDPTPHIRREPFGTVLVPLLSFAASGWMIGWASTPYDPRWALAHPKRAGWMSLAGPAANLLLVVAAGVAIRIGLAAGVFEPGGGLFTHLLAGGGGTLLHGTAILLGVLFTLNLLLCVFNLLPVPPLDGSGALALLLPDDLARRFQRSMARPQLALIGLLAAWWVLPWVFRPVSTVCVALLFAGSGA